MTEQRFTFDAVADLYDAARPDYPAALFDDLMAAADLEPGDRALEVGCGTGKATTGLAERGLSVTAIDPGPAMLEAARRRLAGYEGVSFVASTFEDFAPQPPPYRLIAAAQAWHWVEHQTGLDKAARLLGQGGVLAIFGNVRLDPPAEVMARLAPAYAAADRSGVLAGRERWYLPDGPIPDMIAASGRFAPVAHAAYAWSRPHTAQSFAALIETFSNVQMLTSDRRAVLLNAVIEAIDAAGGVFDLGYETHLYHAARRG